MASDPPAFRPPGMPTAESPDGPPAWDQDEADWFVGKYALVGITYLASDGETVTAQSQYHGRIVSAVKSVGFTIECEGKWQGEKLVVPPDISAFQMAGPGDYKLRSTGETVTDPDVLAKWQIKAPVRS